MSYVEKNLISGEKLVYRTGIHWIVLFWPFVFAVLLAGAAVAVYMYRNDWVIVSAALIAVAALVLIVAGVRRGSAGGQFAHQRGVRLRAKMFHARHHPHRVSSGRQRLHQQAVGFVATTVRRIVERIMCQQDAQVSC